jgi:hypothetical protein
VLWIPTLYSLDKYLHAATGANGSTYSTHLVVAPTYRTHLSPTCQTAIQPRLHCVIISRPTIPIYSITCSRISTTSSTISRTPVLSNPNDPWSRASPYSGPTLRRSPYSLNHLPPRIPDHIYIYRFDSWTIADSSASHTLLGSTRDC